MRLLSSFFTPILLFVAAGFVWWHNNQGGEIIAFFFLDEFFPNLRGDPGGMGELTVGILAAVASVTTLTSSLRYARRWKPPKDEQD